MNTTENNKIIAEFLHGKNAVHANQYHENWNELMEVVEKIESLGYNFNITSQNATALQNHSAIYQTNIYRIDGTNKIQATYETVVEFIKWYNLQNS